MKKCFLVAISLALINITSAQKTIIFCGQLIDVNALQVQKEMSVIITGNTITDVIKGYAIPGAGDKIIDLKNKTVMPG